MHVAPQMKTAGYVCLWEGCKVFNKRSSSLSWLERHVLSHSGNKPFKCIFPGCGLSFSSQVKLHFSTKSNHRFSKIESDFKFIHLNFCDNRMHWRDMLIVISLRMVLQMERKEIQRLLIERLMLALRKVLAGKRCVIGSRGLI